MKVCHTCEELESNAKCSRFVVYFINVKNTHICYIKLDLMRISHNVRDIGFVCLFVFILYVPSTMIQFCRDGSSWVEPVLS